MMYSNSLKNKVSSKKNNYSKKIYSPIQCQKSITWLTLLNKFKSSSKINKCCYNKSKLKSLKIILKIHVHFERSIFINFNYLIHQMISIITFSWNISKILSYNMTNKRFCLFLWLVLKIRVPRYDIYLWSTLIRHCFISPSKIGRFFLNTISELNHSELNN